MNSLFRNIMCIDIMETQREIESVTCRRKRLLRWKQGSCFRDDGEKRLKKWTSDLAKLAARKYRRRGRCGRGCRSHRCQNRVILDPCEIAYRPRPALGNGEVPARMGAPENTTQYLMHIEYEDLVSDTMSDSKSDTKRNLDDAIDVSSHRQPELLYSETTPQIVYSSLDYEFEDSFEFQQRDFENMFMSCQESV